ncbi:MAG: hypothetical protein ACEQSE_00915 [Candidatus Aquirickettsiella gammari]
MVPAPTPFDLKLTGGAGGAAGDSAGTSNNGLAFNFSTPFNFDNSGWVVNMHAQGNTNSAQGNRDANMSTQSASATPTASTSAGGLGAISSGNMLPLILAAAGIFILMRR